MPSNIWKTQYIPRMKKQPDTASENTRCEDIELHNDEIFSGYQPGQMVEQ